MTHLVSLLYLAGMAAMAVAGTAVAVTTGPRPMRRPLVALCFLAALWCLADLLANLATTVEQMRVLAYVFVPVWALVPWVGLRAALALVGKRRTLSSPAATVLLLLPAATCAVLMWSGSLFVDFTPAGVHGPYFHSHTGPSVVVVSIYFTAYLVAGGLVLRRSPSLPGPSSRNRVTTFIVFAVYPITAAGLLVNGGLSLAGIFTPYVASLGLTTALLLLVTGLLRADLFEPVREVRRSLAVALAASELRYRTLIETCPDPIGLTDLDGRIHAANGRMAELLGFASAAELVERRVCVTDLTTAESLPQLRAGMARVRTEGRVVDLRFDIRRPDGRVVPAEGSFALVRSIDGQPEAIMGVGREISERLRTAAARRALEAELERTQTTDSLGLLAGGVAHDFNNLLVGILGHASLARRELHDDTIAAGLADELVRVAERTAVTTRQMLAYSGRDTFVVEPVDLSQLLVDVAALARASVPRSIALEYDLAPSLPWVRTDVNQMQLVLINLLAHAADAIGATPGVITITTAIVRVGADAPIDRLSGTPVPAGSYVSLSVSHTGPDDGLVTADPLFVPFAAAAHGRGRLGLAAVAGIVRSHRGALVVASEREGKSRLQVLLPCPPAPPLGTARRLTPLPPGGAAFRGSGTVLVVDDEEMVREVARIALCQAGFEVLTAADGAEGVALVRARGARIVAVILDLTMPRLDGRAAFAQIRALRAELPVLIISGYSHEEANERISVAGIAGFVQKPFAPADLIAALRTALDPAVRQPAAPPAAALAEAAPGPPTRD